VNLTTTSQRYGFLPELLGRFSRIVPFNALGETELRNILSQQVLSIWSDEMSLHEIDMSVETCNFGRGIWRVIGGLHCFLKVTSQSKTEKRCFQMVFGTGRNTFYLTSPWISCILSKV